MKLFGASWCGPCQTTKAKLNDLGVEYTFIDIDDNMEAAREAGVRGVPTAITESGERLVGYEKIINHAQVQLRT